jgi:prepilin-type N-terminal cleavage/methylation domain-containing protein
MRRHIHNRSGARNPQAGGFIANCKLRIANCQFAITNSQFAIPRRRGGFTLVEMLVSVALVLLIMTLFAQAFGIASGSIKKQRGLAENDQRARSMVTILLGDLQKRTYRQREDAITQPVNLPVDVDETNPTNLQDQFAVFMKRLEDRANRLSLGLVPLHPDYFIGGAPRNLASLPTSPSTADSPGAAFRTVDGVRERGYLHISEGNPADGGDDVLKFTINMANTELGNLNTRRLTGRAVSLLPTWETGDPANPIDDQELNENQPIWDDGIGWVEDPITGVRRMYLPGETGTTASRYAEIAIFIRNGNLYRRTNLIREPLEHVNGAQTGIGQPTDDSGPPPVAPGTGPLYFDPATNANYLTPEGDSFWNDFDHGATRFDAGGSGHIRFHEIASLDNTIAGEKTGGAGLNLAPPHRYWSLGNPRNRFGHDHTNWAAGGLQGRPKEYMNPNNPLTFIGAYTHAETSNGNFGFPGLPIYNGGGTSPMRWGSLAAGSASDVNRDGRIDLLDDFYRGPREGEDLLLANCHAFDIKVWDDALGRFVDLGHSTSSGGTPVGDMHIQAILDGSSPIVLDPANYDTVNNPGRFQAAHPLRRMGRYGGLATDENRVFDTWHPAFNFTNDVRVDPMTMNDIVRPDNDPPPYRPLWTDRADFADTVANGGTGGLVPQFWRPGWAYSPGDRVFPWPNFPDGTSSPPMPPHMSFFYVCVEAIDGDDPPDGARSHLTEQPNWPEAPGARIEDGASPDRLVWKAIPNTIGLKAIQITLRFFDPTSGQMRQLTITHSFVEL